MIDSTVSVKHPRAGATVVELLGEHDLAEKERFQMLFHRLVATNDLVVVDVSKAKFIDCSVIGTLFEALVRRSNGARHFGYRWELRRS